MKYIFLAVIAMAMIIAPTTTVSYATSTGDEKFCNIYNNDNGPPSEYCIHQSMGDCKNDERHGSGHDQVGGECHKKDKEPSQGSANTQKEQQQKPH